MERILIVEDERNMNEVLKMLLEGEGYEVASAYDGNEGIDILNKDIFDLVITDINMPGIDGFGVLKTVKEISPDTIVVMITAFGTTERAIEAMKLGAYDYIDKPFKIDEIRLIVKKALERKKLSTEIRILKDKVSTTYQFDNIIGKSAKMQQILLSLPKIAKGMSNVLILGESGAGKELIAHAIHNLSDRSDREFVAVNCAAFPEGLLESELFGHMKGAFTGAVSNKQGLFEVADKGSIFLDEIAEMPLSLQSKLLRVIEDSTFRRVGGISDIKVDVRVISATNKNLEKQVKEGKFREDLYYRLNVIPVLIPPLRERKEDIPLLVEHFLKKFGVTKRRFGNSAMAALVEHEWKGNVRELENIIERVVTLSEEEVIKKDMLPMEVLSRKVPDSGAPALNEDGVDLDSVLEDIERSYLIKALDASKGVKNDAAKLLNISFRSFRHRLDKYGIK
ncbi:MAG: sigma-54-dependent Fis family transcriptional regulator [Nitrospirota bacterium]|nr:MAG: sigma-54-dependent Fis family transcriptional regulator [Nitrospirota bacterium]